MNHHLIPAVTLFLMAMLGVLGIIILLAIQQQSRKIMALEDKIAELAGDEDKLLASFRRALGVIAGIPAVVAAAVAAALANVPGVDNSAAIAAIDAIDAKVRDEVDQATAALHPDAEPTPPTDSTAAVEQAAAATDSGGAAVDNAGGQPDPAS